MPTSPPPPRSNDGRGFGGVLVLVLVLVLSEAVLVIVIGGRMGLRAGFDNAFEFHRHPSQPRDDPMQHRFHRSLIRNLAALWDHQDILDGCTFPG